MKALLKWLESGIIDRINKAERIIIIACGTSWHAGLIGEYLIEEFAKFR